ncbi:MAG: metallophosphoesterase [Lachnospiraceae bacterium]|nr:metallophosphoesterase [Lachnospiraceae bacterium]
MARYIMADIHGDMDSFNKMLKKIDFKSGEDFLIINGDVFDRGENGVEIMFMIMDMVKKGDAVMLKGNHELFGQMYMEGTLSENNWIRFFGESTLNSLKELNYEKRSEVLEFIKGLPLYLEYDIPQFGKTVITHTGLMNDYIVTDEIGKILVVESIESAAQKDEYNLLISSDIHFWRHEQLEMLDKYIICGHVPTYQLGQEYTGKIMKTRKYIDIDAGAGYKSMGGRLSCYSIDDNKEFYV